MRSALKESRTNMTRNPATRRLALVTVGFLVLGCAACSTASGTSADSKEHPGALAKNCGTGKKFKIGFAQANNAEPYRQHVNAELKQLAKGYPEFDITIADGRGDSNKQISDVENFQTQQIDLLMISPSKPSRSPRRSPNSTQRESRSSNSTARRPATSTRPSSAVTTRPSASRRGRTQRRRCCRTAAMLPSWKV